MSGDLPDDGPTTNEPPRSPDSFSLLERFGGRIAQTLEDEIASRPSERSTPPMDGDRFVPYSEDPSRHVYETGGIKDNVGKSRVDLIPTSAIMAAGDILAFGAAKYKPHNWRYGLPWSDTYASLQRHLWAWANGKDLDKETGKSHLWHGLCQLMFLVEYEATATGTDDRWSTVSAQQALRDASRMRTDGNAAHGLTTFAPGRPACACGWFPEPIPGETQSDAEARVIEHIKDYA